MPTYTVTYSGNCLSTEGKACLAAGITQAHQQVTGAPSYFAQVIFNSVDPGNYYLGGRVLLESQIFVNGQIRAGRDAETRQNLLHELLAATARASTLPPHQIWVYLSELPPGQMVEFGHTLPPAGQEEAWLGKLPAWLQDRLKKLIA